jgi:2-phosphoglycerate kinase
LSAEFADMRREWTATVVCGASGVGKSSVAIPLAARYGVPLGETDDIVTALKTITSPADQPVLHYWDTHPDTMSWSPDRIADLHLDVSDVLLPAFRAVIADHIEFDAPVVLEGDHVVPELAVGFGTAVRAVVLVEPDVDRIAANFGAREPGADHGFRARVSLATGARLAARAHAVGVPVVRAWPWTDGVDRVDAALVNAADAVRPG